MMAFYEPTKYDFYENTIAVIIKCCFFYGCLEVFPLHYIIVLCVFVTKSITKLLINKIIATTPGSFQWSKLIYQLLV